MINFDFTKGCYSCSACANVCPEDAIRFDDKLLPAIDSAKCVNCGKCEKVCIKLNEAAYLPKLDEDAEGFVCKNIDQQERIDSSSGGVFILLAKKVLAQGGYVCGCVYDGDFQPKHIVTNEFTLVQKMMGSKYVKSDMGSCIREMDILLRKRTPVLFSGVPCQSAAVKKCLEKYPNLIIVNIVCHGSIERDFWKSYLDLERQRGDIMDVTMRDKSRGWDNYGLRIRFQDGTEHTTYRNQDGYFLRCFTSGLFQRERCLHCSYKGSAIVGDLLLGDGWGMDQVFPELCDSYGVSAVVALTETGKHSLAELQPYLISQHISVSQIVARNGRIVSPAPNIAFRNLFQKKCEKKPKEIKNICEKYANPTIICRIINKMYSNFFE